MVATHSTRTKVKRGIWPLLLCSNNQPKIQEQLWQGWTGQGRQHLYPICTQNPVPLIAKEQQLA